IAANKQVRHRPVVDDITIKLAPGVSIGVERLNHVLGGVNDDVLRKTSINRPDQDLRGIFRVRVEVGDLSQSVDAGIGPTTGVQAGRFARQLADRTFESLLYRAETGLDLPAEKVRAVVADRQLDVPHMVTIKLCFSPSLFAPVSRRFGWRSSRRLCGGC